MRGPTVTGLDVPGPGSGVCQTMFLWEDHSVGNPVAVLTPWPPGPRNCVQSPAAAVGKPRRQTNKTTARTAKLMAGAPGRLGESRTDDEHCQFCGAARGIS